MSDKVYIPNDVIGGRTSGPQMRMLDFLKLQFFVEKGFSDFLKTVIVPASDAEQVSGFDATLTDGLSISIAPGLALDLQGMLYNTADAATPIELAAADPDHPRIDMIYAGLEANVPGEIESRDFRVLPTDAERLAGTILPTALRDVPTQLLMRATVAVRAGVPAADPQSPALAAGEVPLWQVRVEAGAVALTVDKLTDVRNLMRHLGNPFDVAALSGLRKTIVNGRMVLDSIVASGVERGMIKLGPSFTIDPDGTLHSIFENLEALQDALSTSFSGVAPIGVAYNDPFNRWDFSIALATALANGAMASADKAKLDASTSANTASAIMQRTGSGDANARDLKAERQFVFADNSVKFSAVRDEEYLEFFDFGPTPITLGGPGYVAGTITILGAGNNTFYDRWITVESLAGIPCCLETVHYNSNVEGFCSIELYNVTDALVLTSVNKSINHSNLATAGRGSIFNFTGTGRKRLYLRFRGGEAGQNPGIEAKIWSARIVFNPKFSTCSSFDNPNCPVG